MPIPLAGLKTFWRFLKINNGSLPGSPPGEMDNLSGSSGATFFQPLPTLKENGGWNSSERYSPGRRALSYSGRGRSLLASSAHLGDPLG